MPIYKVVKQCYVPVGGGAKYKRPGQVVTLTAREAKSLDGCVELVEAQASVRKPDTALTVRNPDTPAPSKPREAAGVTIDEDEEVDHVGDPQADHE